MNTSHTTGAVIARVEPDSPAARAGLHQGDLVVAVNGEPVRSGTQLRNTIGLTRIGSDVDLTIDRRGSEYRVGVHVEAAASTAARQRVRQR
jgi:serine protease Do